MAQFVNNRARALEIPFIREEPGIYKFGFRRVFVRLENGVLSIRVGGGYMLIEDFIELYTPLEMEKILLKTRRGSSLSGGDSPTKGLTPKGQGATSFPEGRFVQMYTPKRGGPALRKSTTMMYTGSLDK